MEDTCKDCKSWEEEIFWTHFQSIHFFKFLRGDFVQRLEIPEKFAKNIKKKLPETVTLKGPSGIIWDVGLTLTVDDDTLCFERGWENFVKDHSMVENDLLIFKYNGVSRFDVLMFDGQSLCEKASSYFVKKCVHTEFDSRYQTKRNMTENPDEIVHNSSQCGLESSPEKSTNNDIDMRPSRQPNNSAATNKKMQNVAPSSRSILARHNLGGKELSNFVAEVKVETEFEHTTMDGDIFSPRQASCKRSVTEAEKANVILMAQEALTKEGFMVVMKPTHIGKKYYMAIPIAWVAKYASKENADVILRINKRTWRARYYYQRSRDCGGLSGGWRQFVNDNNLKEHDACVFEPANIGKKPMVLDVSIFHVLQAVVPLSQSSCEKVSSYFMRKRVHTEFDSGYQTKRNMVENSDEIVHNSSRCGLESSPEKSTNNDIDMRPSRQPNNSAATNKKMQNMASSSRSIHARQSLGDKKLSTFAGEVKVKTEIEHTTTDGDIFSPWQASYKRSVTQAEKANVILMAQEALTKEGFMVVMKPTHVGRKFFMAIPTAWVAKYATKEKADVILRINKRTWRTRSSYQASRASLGLSGGWRKFVNDNNLKEHDACVFKPVDIGRKPIVLDVSIFRALQVAVPLRQVSPVSS